MKQLSVIVILLAIFMSTSAQNLIDIYKSGTINLVPDKTYAANNDWDKVFATYNDTIYGKPMGDRKTLLILPNGSALVNNPYRNYYTKFSPNGTFITEMGMTSSTGKRFKKIHEAKDVINDSIIFTGLNNMGDMYSFNFDGIYKKSLKLDYMTRGMIALPNGKIAVVGWVIWAKKFREFVAIVDYETNEEEVIWEHFTDRCPSDKHCKLFNYSYTFESRGAISFNTMPYTKSTGISRPPHIACVNNKLIVALASTGEIITYDLNGKLLNKEKIDWATNYISVEEQKKIQQEAINKYKSIKTPQFAKWVSAAENEKARNSIVKQMKEDIDKIIDPIPVPAFSTIIQDSDDNLLFFEYAQEKDNNKFNVWIYKNGGEFICQSKFVCDDYDLVLNSGKIVFHDGYIYGLQKLKDSNGVPLRLVRFKLATAE